MNVAFISSRLVTAKTAFHHFAFSFITAHIVHHCTLKQALPITDECIGSLQAIISLNNVIWRRRVIELLNNKPRPIGPIMFLHEHLSEKTLALFTVLSEF